MILLLWLTQRNCWYFAIVSLPTKFNSDMEISGLNIYYIFLYICICNRCLFQYLHLLSLRFSWLHLPLLSFWYLHLLLLPFLIFASAIVALPEKLSATGACRVQLRKEEQPCLAPSRRWLEKQTNKQFRSQLNGISD